MWLAGRVYKAGLFWTKYASSFVLNHSSGSNYVRRKLSRRNIRKFTCICIIFDSRGKVTNCASCEIIFMETFIYFIKMYIIAYVYTYILKWEAYMHIYLCQRSFGPQLKFLWHVLRTSCDFLNASMYVGVHIAYPGYLSMRHS